MHFTGARAMVARTAGPTCPIPRSSSRRLRDTGLPADDPNLQKAIVFVSRMPELDKRVQRSNLGVEGQRRRIHVHGRQWRAERGRPGGGRWPPLVREHDVRRAQKHDLRRASQDDPRVKAALTYITNHYTLDENPGLGQQGLYYYYHTFAKTMALLADPTLTDAAGVSHDWRSELVKAIAKRQLSEGGWVNPADRFMEGDPNLVTAYALLALAYTRTKAK